VPLTPDNVISTLLDPVLQKIDFWVDSVHVRGDAYRRVAQLIYEDQILVVSGDNPKRAEYDSVRDTITTQLAGSPPDLTNRGVLVHESTHAIADMEVASVTWRTNEVAAYLAENLYLLLSSKNASAFNRAYSENSILPFIRTMGLDQRPGEGRHFSMDDVAPLIRDLDKYPGYHQESAQMSVSNGISRKPRKSADMPSDEQDTKSASTSQVAYRSPVNIPFDFQRYDINPAAADALDQIAEFIKARKGSADKVYLTGYADSVGDAPHNLTLSRLRAEAVSRWLVRAKAVAPADILVVGKGWANPAAPNRRPGGADDPDGRAKNRRVEVLIK
jgi:outer membrane protein OmpA-like peptidoglycan-associated protein